MAEEPARIKKLFHDNFRNKLGIFAIQLTKNGVNVQVIVDDKIPCKNKEPIFSENHGDEVWVVILEKAWAKLHGDYF